MASARLHTLGGYDYTLQYKPSLEHSNADSLNRLPLPVVPSNVPEPAETVFLMEALTLQLTAAKIKLWSRRDRILSKIIDLVLHGWQYLDNPDLKPYEHRKDELSVHDGCLLWGNRVVILPTGRQQAMDLFHDGHPGASRMKSLVRSYIWWPDMDRDLEIRVKECEACQRARNQH